MAAPAAAGLALWAAPGGAQVLAWAVLAFPTGSAEVLRDTTAQTLLPDVVEAATLAAANTALHGSEALTGQFIAPLWRDS